MGLVLTDAESRGDEARQCNNAHKFSVSCKEGNCIWRRNRIEGWPNLSTEHLHGERAQKLLKLRYGALVSLLHWVSLRRAWKPG